MGEWNVFYIYILGLAGGRYYQKLLSLSLDLYFIFFLFLVAFLLFFSIAIFSPYFLLVRLSLQFVTLLQSRKLVKLVLEELQTDVELPSPMTSQHNGCPHFFVSFFNSFLLKVYCGLQVVCCICEGRFDSNVQAMITWLILTKWSSLSTVREGSQKFITHSFTLQKLY